MKIPKTQVQETLYLLLTNEYVTGSLLYCMYNIHGYRKAISILRNKYNVPIQREDVTVKNRFGRTSIYGKWYIKKEDIKKVLETYNSLTDDK